MNKRDTELELQGCLNQNPDSVCVIQVAKAEIKCALAFKLFFFASL